MGLMNYRKIPFKIYKTIEEKRGDWETDIQKRLILE
jgi:hypothetical protein